MHAAPDDCTTQPSGGTGLQIGCGEIANGNGADTAARDTTGGRGRPDTTGTGTGY